jgi:hypothetical protein
MFTFPNKKNRAKNMAINKKILITIKQITRLKILRFICCFIDSLLLLTSLLLMFSLEKYVLLIFILIFFSVVLLFVIIYFSKKIFLLKALINQMIDN